MAITDRGTPQAYKGAIPAAAGHVTNPGMEINAMTQGRQDIDIGLMQEQLAQLRAEQDRRMKTYRQYGTAMLIISAFLLILGAGVLIADLILDLEKSHPSAHYELRNMSGMFTIMGATNMFSGRALRAK
jgi:hypothetical protein